MGTEAIHLSVTCVPPLSLGPWWTLGYDGGGLFSLCQAGGKTPRFLVASKEDIREWQGGGVPHLSQAHPKPSESPGPLSLL